MDSKEMRRLVPTELSDDTLNAVSGGYLGAMHLYACICNGCGKLVHPEAFSVELDLCNACIQKIEQKRNAGNIV